MKVRSEKPCHGFGVYPQHQQPRHHRPNPHNKICLYWRAGKCTRNRCAFLHCETLSVKQPAAVKRNNVWKKDSEFSNAKGDAVKRSIAHKIREGVRLVQDVKNTEKVGVRLVDEVKNTEKIGVRCVHEVKKTKKNGVGLVQEVKKTENLSSGSVAGNSELSKKSLERVCSEFLAGKCSSEDKCNNLHAWSVGSVAHVATLKGHQNAITCIVLPSGNNKLCTGSKDGTLRVWDCHSAECVNTVKMGGEVGCLISEGVWVFVGVPGAVKAFNTENGLEVTLTGFKGQAYALVIGTEILFAGTQEGSIVGWKFGEESNCLEPSVRLTGHRLGVVSLCVGAGKLYSGSMDHTIKEWDLGTLKCVNTISEHSSAVMSLLYWGQYLLSCSLDKTVKAWARTESGGLNAVYTHNDQHGLLSLFGMNDKNDKSVLFILCNDNSLSLFNLPTFCTRGRIFSKEEFRSLHGGPDGLFFTGDGSGELKVWRLLECENS